jgi:hypothetical protein
MNVYTRWSFFQGVQTSKYTRQTIVTREYKQKEGNRVNQKSSANDARRSPPSWKKKNQKARAPARAYRNTLAERPPPQAALRLADVNILLGLTLNNDFASCRHFAGSCRHFA